MRYPVYLLAALILAVVLMSCGKKSVPPPPNLGAEFEFVGDSILTAKANLTIVDAFQIRVVGADGAPLAGVEVEFSQITPRTDTLWQTERSATTGANGVASAVYRIDHTVEVDTVTVTAPSLDSITAYFVINVLPSDNIAIDTSYPGNQVGTIGDTLAQPLRLKVTDIYDNIITDLRVRFVATKRGLVLTDSSSLSDFEKDTAYTRLDDSGWAEAHWVLPYNPSLIDARVNAYVLRNDSAKDSALFVAAAISFPSLLYYNDARMIFEENCFICHSGPGVPGTTYGVDFYWRANDGVNIVPGDSTSQIVRNANPDHNLTEINKVEQDKILHWVFTHNAAPGVSGLNNYTNQMKGIIDAKCATCHGGATPDGQYNMETHADIRGTGVDGTSNALPGDSLSLLVQRLLPAGNMRQYVTEAEADSLIRWIVVDSLRQY